MMSSSRTTMTLSRTTLMSSAAAVAVVLVITSCSSANSGSPSKTGAANTLRIVLPLEPPTLEPCEIPSVPTSVVVNQNITEPLLERNGATGKLNPTLATKWVATGGKEWTFTLRAGVKFQDGTPFNAQAAAFSIDRAVNLKLLCQVEGQVFGNPNLTLNAVNDTTLTVTTETPDPLLPLKLSFVDMVPTSTSTTAKVREPIGTGPYKIKQWIAGQSLTLERYKGYWGDAPAYQTVEYQWRSEGSVAAAMITKGEADIATSLSPTDGAGGLAITYPNNQAMALRFSGTIAPLNDIRVRQAINYAIDRKGLLGALYAGISKLDSQLVPSNAIGYNKAILPWPFNLSKAKELIAQAKAAGTPVDQPITIIVRSGMFTKVEDTAQILQQQLTLAGLKVQIKVMDTVSERQYQFRPFVMNQGANAVILEHGNGTGDAAYTLNQYLLSTGLDSTIGSPELDKMILDAEQASGANRQAAFERALKYEHDNIVQTAVIAQMRSIMAKSKKVSYTPPSGSDEIMRLADMKPAS